MQQMSFFLYTSLFGILQQPILDELINSHILSSLCIARALNLTFPRTKSVSPCWPITEQLTQQFLAVWVVCVWGHCVCWYTLYFGLKADISNSIHHIWLSDCVCLCVCARSLEAIATEPLTSPDHLWGGLPSFGETVNSTFTSFKKKK